MQQIPVRAFHWNKETQVLSAEESDLRHLINMGPLLNYETFEVVGERETRKYCFYELMREESRFETGDIQGWKFRPVDGFGRGIEGPRIIIFND